MKVSEVVLEWQSMNFKDDEVVYTKEELRNIILAWEEEFFHYFFNFRLRMYEAHDKAVDLRNFCLDELKLNERK